MKTQSLFARRALIVAGCFLGLMFILQGKSTAAVPASPEWNITQTVVPTNLELGSVTPTNQGPETRSVSPKIRLNLLNVGGAPFANAVVTDVLPAGLVPTAIPGAQWSTVNPASPREVEAEVGGGNPESRGNCSVEEQTVTCTIPNKVIAGTSLSVFISLEVTATQPENAPNDVSVESGGQPTASRNIATSIGDSSPRFAFPPTGEEGIGGAAYDQAGAPPAAGSHPFSLEMTAKIQSKLNGGGTPYYSPYPSEPLRSLQLELPPGVVINPRATSVRCPKSLFVENQEKACPAASQIGAVHPDLLGVFEGPGLPLFNLQPEPGTPAEFGFGLSESGIVIKGGLSGGYDLTAASSELLARYPIDGVRVELWGVPSDPRHDRLRSNNVYENFCRYGCAITESPRPLVTMPSSCSSSLGLGVTATSWLGSVLDQTEVFRTPDGRPEPVEGCENLAFNPSVNVGATADAADSPSGLTFDLKVPQSESLGGLASATVKKVTVELPPGMALNPPAASGLSACSAAQIGIGNNQPASCPNSSTVGSAEIDTPLLESPLRGSIYLAEQNNNPFGSLLALYLVAEGEGVVIKLPGRVDADPRTGQLTATFDDNPQLPFENLKVELNSGSRATLVTPSACGTYTSRTEVTSWASPTPVVLNSPLTVSSGCSTGGFSPRVEAGTADPTAGSFSPFTLRVVREDGEQNLSRISATLPEGLLAKLAGVPLCPEAQTGSGDCPASSQVGTTTTGVGAGTAPLFLPQAGKPPTAVYLAGSYEGAPYSLVAKVPADAGPFALGTIAVRVALRVDPYTAQVTASSDPLPQILEGIPIAYRDVRVEVTRPDFTLNPTSCEPKQVSSSIVSNSGAVASPSSRFQVGDCSGLGFEPSLKVSLRGSTRRTGHPALKAVLTYPKRGNFANIARAQVNLPGSEFLDQGNVGRACTKPVLLAGACPERSVYGKARAWSPLLERPLEGPVYLVGGFGYKLPALVAELNGQIRILLVGKIDTGKNKGIRNTFEAVPDAQISRFVLELKGGRRYGLLENSANLCRRSETVGAIFKAQDGDIRQLSTKIANSCRGGSRGAKPKRSRK